MLPVLRVGKQHRGRRGVRGGASVLLLPFLCPFNSRRQIIQGRKADLWCFCDELMKSG